MGRSIVHALTGFTVALTATVGAHSMLTAHGDTQAAPTASVAGCERTTGINVCATLDTSRIVAVGAETVSPADMAEEYAKRHDLTCGPVADMELDDIVLTVMVHPMTGEPVTNRVIPVDIDGALDSHNQNRVNVMACDAPETDLV